MTTIFSTIAAFLVLVLVVMTDSVVIQNIIFGGMALILAAGFVAMIGGAVYCMIRDLLKFITA